jgi:hypothetical protein
LRMDMEGGKWQRPPYPRVLRRAVAPACL